MSSDPGVVVVARNKALVTQFYELSFNQHQPEQAAAKYLCPGYIQHNPSVADGVAGFLQFARHWCDEYPRMHIDIKQVMAEGDRVALFVNFHLQPGDLGMAIVDIFRIQDDRIAEHWDVIQPVPADSKNGNGMF